MVELVEYEMDKKESKDQELVCRPEVVAFAQLMESKLRANDHKRPWPKVGPRTLFRKLHEEFGEFVDAWTFQRDRVAEEAADVANLLMMLVDRCEQLPDPGVVWIPAKTPPAPPSFQAFFIRVTSGRFGTRARRALVDCGVTNFDALDAAFPDDLWCVPGCGTLTLEHIRGVAMECGVTLRHIP